MPDQPFSPDSLQFDNNLPLPANDSQSVAGSKESSVDLAESEGFKLSGRQIAGALAALLSAAAVTAAIVYFAPYIKELQQFGYPGVFLTSLIGNASVALPIPSLAVTFAMGGVLNWVIVGLVSGVGEALGESTGYLAGLGGSFIIENKRIYKKMHYFMEKHGMLTVFVLSVVPNPFIDLAGIAAGASRYGYHKFLFACWMGKTLKTLTFAWAGAHSINWLMQLL